MLMLVGLACLFPLALYCLTLAMVHQRRMPTMVAGAWDFAGVLLGLSGFLLIGTSVFLLALNPQARSFFLDSGTLRDLYRAYRLGNQYTFLLWCLFFVAMSVSFAFALWQRRTYTVIYHLTPSEFDSILEQVLNRQQLSAMRRGPRWFIGYDLSNPDPARPALQPCGSDDAPLLTEFDTLRKAVFDVDGSAVMRFVTIHWRFATAALRRELEDELTRALEHFPASEGRIGAWLMTAAGCAFIAMFFCLVTFLILFFR